ncbi:MAG: hypothetical protein ABI862_15090 [Ilumatobacteraceae bacterium]
MDLATVAPAFVEMAHRIVWWTLPTVDRHQRHAPACCTPIWEWDGDVLAG